MSPIQVRGRALAQAPGHRPFPQLTPGAALRRRPPQADLPRAAGPARIGLPELPALAPAWKQAPARAPGHQPFRQLAPGAAPRRTERQAAPRRAALRPHRRPAARIQRHLPVSPTPVRVPGRAPAQAMRRRPFPQLTLLAREALRGQSPKVAFRRAARRARTDLPGIRTLALVWKQSPTRTPGRRSFRQLAPTEVERGAAPGRDRGPHRRSAGRAGMSHRSSPSSAARPPGGGHPTSAGLGDRGTAQAVRLAEPYAARLRDPRTASRAAERRTAPRQAALRLRRRPAARVQRRLPASPAPVQVPGSALAQTPGRRPFQQLALPRAAPQQAERQAAPRRSALRLQRRPSARVQRRLPVFPAPVRVPGSALAQTPGRRPFRQLALPGAAPQQAALRQAASRQAALRLQRRAAARVQRLLPVSPAPVQVLGRAPGRRPFRQLAPPGAAPHRSERRAAPGRDRGAHQRPAAQAEVSCRPSPSSVLGRLGRAGPSSRRLGRAGSSSAPRRSGRAGLASARRRSGCPGRRRRPVGLRLGPVPVRPGSARTAGSPRRSGPPPGRRPLGCRGTSRCWDRRRRAAPRGRPGSA